MLNDQDFNIIVHDYYLPINVQLKKKIINAFANLCCIKNVLNAIKSNAASVSKCIKQMLNLSSVIVSYLLLLNSCILSNGKTKTK